MADQPVQPPPDAVPYLNVEPVSWARPAATTTTSSRRGKGKRRPSENKHNVACLRCRERKVKCSQEFAVEDVCARCTMRREECIWPMDSEPTLARPPGPLTPLASAKSEISRLNKLVDVLVQRIEDREAMNRAAGGRAPPYWPAGPTHHHPFPPHHADPPRPHPRPTPIDGATALLALSNSPVSTGPSRQATEIPPPTRDLSHETWGSAQSTLPRPMNHPNDSQRAPPRPSSAARIGNVNLPSLRLTIAPSATSLAAPQPSSNTVTTSPSRYHHAESPGDSRPRSFAPSSHSVGRGRPLSSSSDSIPMTPLRRSGPFSPAVLFFATLPPEEMTTEEAEEEQEGRLKYERQAYTPMIWKEAREAHEQRYDAALGEVLKCRGISDQQRPPSRLSNPVRPTSRGEGSAVRTEMGGTGVRGAMRLGSGDAMLGAGVLESPVDPAPGSPKGRVESSLGRELTYAPTGGSEDGGESAVEHQQRAGSPLSSLGDASDSDQEMEEV